VIWRCAVYIMLRGEVVGVWGDSEVRGWCGGMGAEARLVVGDG